MASYLTCIPCIVDSALSLAEAHLQEETERFEFMRRVLGVLAEKAGPKKTPPELAAETHRVIRELLGKDPYAELKSQYNQKMLELEDELEGFVSGASDPFAAGLKVAAAGNIIDFGAEHRLTTKDVLAVVKKTLDQKLPAAVSGKLFQTLSRAGSLLYLGDNAGEIVFDKVFIRTLKRLFPELEVTFAVRGAPTLNDVTEDDAYQVGMDELARIVSNGSDVPGTALGECRAEFRDIFYSADLVIAKGQGNSESLDGVRDVPIFFVFLCKCDFFSAKFGLKKHDIAVVSNT